VKTVTHRHKVQTGIFLILIGFLSVPAKGQAKNEDVFAAVPLALRARLVERLKLLVEYQRLEAWEEQYDLLSVLFTQGKGKREFVKESREWYAQGLGTRLLDFIPKAVVVNSESLDHGEWTIYGCATVREKKRNVRLYALVDAHRENGDWYFSQVGIITSIDGNAKRCPY
jgi:hypothetical protein